MPTIYSLGLSSARQVQRVREMGQWSTLESQEIV